MAQTSDEIVIHAGRLLAEPGQPPKSGQSLRISDGKIAEVAAGFLDPPPGARLIDLKDKFVLPGLIDCHVHLTMQLGPGERMRFVEDSDPKVGLDGAHRARITLEAGFTTVRDLGARKPEVIYALRQAVAEGQGARPAHPLRRRDPFAHRRPWPDLWLSPGRLRLHPDQRRHL